MNNVSAMDEDWRTLVGFLPPDWRGLAAKTAALRGLRQDKSEENLLRTLLLHVGCGYSLRETVVRAQSAGLAALSDVALLKRLRKAQEWLHQLCVGLFVERGFQAPAGPPQRVRLLDATTIKEPGPTGSPWRVHYSLELPSLRCDFFKVTATEGEGTGEGFWQFPIAPGDYLIADAGYSIMKGIRGAGQQGASVLVRLNPKAVCLAVPGRRVMDLLARLRTLKRPAQVGSWAVQLLTDEGPVAGRICAVRKTEAAIDRAHRRLRREASKHGRSLLPETLEYACYVVVFTTFPAASFSAVQVLSWYRVRWQVELVFKRFKQIARVGHLPKYEEQSAKAWLYGKLLVALLTEKLIAQARAFSPWGYELETVPSGQPVA